MSGERRRQAKAKRRRDRQAQKRHSSRQEFRVVNADATGATIADLSSKKEFGADNPLKIATYNMGSPVYGDGSNPGSGAICENCGTAFYIDNMLPSVTTLQGPDASVHHMIGPCPNCDGLGAALMYTNENEFGRTVATHPEGVLLAAQITHSLLEDGKIEPEEAVDRLRDLRPLAPLLEWVDENSNRLSLLVAALGLVVSGFQMLDDDGLSEKQIEQIVRSVVDEMDDQPVGPAAPPDPSTSHHPSSVPPPTLPD